MKQRITSWGVAAASLAFAAGVLCADLAPRQIAHAQAASALPSIFGPGARLLSPTGPVEVLEVEGSWIRIKSLHPLAKADGEQWMYVPSIPGTWLLDTRPVEPEKK